MNLPTVATNPVSLLEQEFVWGSAPAVQTLNSLVSDLAPTRIPVLLLGETGTGKEAYTRLIHRLSGGIPADLRHISCPAIQSAQIEEYLRETPRHACDGLANGTILLDEIEALDQECQKLLLSFLRKMELHPQSEGVQPRLVSTATGNFLAEVEAGRFRPELYFRINGASLRLPALRERTEDIPSFLNSFLARHAQELNRKAPLLNQETMELLMSYHWPGNLRELDNLVRMMVAIGDSGLAARDLHSPRAVPLSSTGRVSSLKVAARAASRQAERTLILQALRRTNWNRKRAAQELRISYKSLLYKIKQIEILAADAPERG